MLPADAELLLQTVLDTNLLVSYLLTHRPPIDKHLALEHCSLVTGATLLEELDRVLCYPRLQRYYNEENRTQYVALIAALSEVVKLS